MKAIAIIDVDDISKFHVNAYRENWDGSIEYYYTDVPLRLLPKRKRKALAKDTDRAVKNLIATGFNQCLDEILGREK